VEVAHHHPVDAIVVLAHAPDRGLEGLDAAEPAGPDGRGHVARGTEWQYRGFACVRAHRVSFRLSLAPQQRLYLRPLPQGQGSLRPGAGAPRRMVAGADARLRAGS